MKFYLFIEFLFLSILIQNTFAQNSVGSNFYTKERQVSGNTETIKLKIINNESGDQLVDLYRTNTYKRFSKYLSIGGKLDENNHLFDEYQFQELARNFGFSFARIDYDKNTIFNNFSSALNSRDEKENEDVFILVIGDRYYYVNAVYFIR
ncbi:MAG: hypothetical protein QE271_11160 [Bacteriovoracaceae bacterium]|nr:hypothetical protein [Bacteriovoracaceae bacterium]